MAQQQSSQLLRVLEQLDEAAWAETMLPLLQANKSAGAAALACKQLRRLCHGNQRELKLTGANCQHVWPMELDVFSRPFPACSSVTFSASSADDMTWRLTCVLPLLARLPNLQSLQLNINSSEASQPAQVGPALQLMRVALPQLRSLHLVLSDSWSSDSQQCWAMLGAVTQLTELAVGFQNKKAADSPRVSLQHLSALRSLGSGLQRLEVDVRRVDFTSPQDCSFLSSLSGLTSLAMLLSRRRSGLATIRSCTALKRLRLESKGGIVLNATECGALAQLTRLTELEIPPSSDTPALLAALRCLSGLQEMRLQAISSSHLPVLAALTQLTRLHGRWVGEPPADQAAAAAQTSCPCVAVVKMTGPFPLAAFPGAKELCLREILQPSRLAGVSQHIKQLEHLAICGRSTEGGTIRSLDVSASVSERVAAVRSLGQLPHLSALLFAPTDDAEAAAMGTITQLQRLTLYVLQGSRVSATGLSSMFIRLGNLRRVSIYLPGLHLSQPEPMSLLAGLSDVSSVMVAAPSAEAWEAAARAAGCRCLLISLRLFVTSCD